MEGLHIAERSAMRLDGELVDVGDAAAHLDRVIGPAKRVRSLALRLRPQHILIGKIAAWVHEAAPLPHRIDIACMRHRRADPPDDPRCVPHVRRTTLRECVVFAGVAVTDRLHTAVELVRDEAWTIDDMRAVRLLSPDLDALARAIEGLHRAPRRAMLERVERVRAQPPVTR